MRRIRATSVACLGVLLLTAACTSGGGAGGGGGIGGGGGLLGGDEWGGIQAAGTIPQTTRPTGSGCIRDVSAGTRNVTGCGANITYTITVPPRCLQFKCGLVFDIHGMTMSAASQDGGTNMRAIGQREGYVVVQPTAAGGNANGTGLQGTAWDFGAGAASPAVARMIDTAADAFQVDPRRIHVSGFSMGGSMTWWLRCHTGNKLASVAPMSFSNTSGGRCPLVMTPTIYQMGGAQDTLSGDTGMQNGLSGTMRNMVQAYNLSNPQTVAEAPGGYTWKRYTKPNGFVFETIVHNYTTPIILHHCIFGAPRPALLCSCTGVQPIKEGEVAMQFFKKHPKGL